MTTNSRRWAGAGLVLHVLLVVTAGTLAYLSALPTWQVLHIPKIDQVLHFVMVGSTTFWLVGVLPRRHATWALGSVLVLSVADELLQSLSPVRSADVRDLAADWAGALVFWLIGRWVWHRPAA